MITQKVVVSPTQKYDFSIIGFQVQSGKNIQVDFKDISSGKKEWEFMVKNKRENAGKYSDIITIKTDSPLVADLKIRIYGNVLNKKIPVE